MKRLIGILFIVTCSACATLNPSQKFRVEFKSDPPNADVTTLSGELLGTTPFTLDNDRIVSIATGGRLRVLVNSPGYMQRELIVEVRGEESYEIKLSRFEKQYFNERLLYDFPREANEMTRDLMQIQAWLFARKTAEAERSLETFQKTYPNIAASYVLSASIESQKGNKDKARLYLLRARALDPTDAVIARMLGKSAPPLPSATTPATPPKTAAAVKGGTP